MKSIFVKIVGYISIYAILNTSISPAFAQGDNAPNEFGEPTATLSRARTPSYSQRFEGWDQVRNASVSSCLSDVLQLGTRAIRNGIHFAINHPFQTLVALLYAQVTTAAALKDYSPQARVELAKLGAHPRKEWGLVDPSREYTKRSIGFEESILNSLTLGAQTYPEMDRFSSGDIITTWQSTLEESAEDRYLFASLRDASGLILVPDTQISQNISSNYEAVALRVLSHNHFALISQSRKYGYWALYLRLFNKNFTPVNEEFEISINDSITERFPSLAAANGILGVAWASVDPEIDYDRYVQFFNASTGSPLSQECLATSTSNGNQYGFGLATLGDVFANLFLSSTDNTFTAVDVHLNFMGTNCTFLVGNTKVNQNQPSSKSGTRLAHVGDGTLLALWVESPSLSANTTISKIMGRFINVTTNPFSFQFTTDSVQINQDEGFFFRNPSASLSSLGDPIVAWFGTNSSDINAGREVRARVFDIHGNPLTREFAPAVNGTDNQDYITVSGRQGVNPIFAWNGDQQGDKDIYYSLLTDELYNHYAYTVPAGIPEPSAPFSTVPQIATPPSPPEGGLAPRDSPNTLSPAGNTLVQVGAIGGAAVCGVILFTVTACAALKLLKKSAKPANDSEGNALSVMPNEGAQDPSSHYQSTVGIAGYNAVPDVRPDGASNDLSVTYSILPPAQYESVNSVKARLQTGASGYEQAISPLK